MRPAEFEYFDPHTIEEALGLLEKHGGGAKILAGGLSLVPMVKLRLAEPKQLIDITKIPSLVYIIENDKLGLDIGALTTFQAIESSVLAKAKCPILGQAARVIGDQQVRNRGTIGGNVSHADPSCDFGPVALCVDAEFKMMSLKGERKVRASEFFVDLYSTALESNELLVEISVPSLSPNSGQAYLKLTRRSGDVPIVSAAVSLTLDKGGVCQAVSIALGSVAATAVKAAESEKALLGQALTDKAMEKAAELATKGIHPFSDIHGSAEYRKEMAAVITKRALKQAASMAGGEK